MSRRTAIKLAAGAAAAIMTGSAPKILAADGDDGFIDVRRPPDSVDVVTEDATTSATRGAGDRWEANGVVVLPVPAADSLRLSLASPKTPVKQVRLTWSGSTAAWKTVLGDHWERSYGDLAWRTPDPKRTNPWYLLANTDAGAHAIGVCTQPSAFCGWTCDADGVHLTCDVRSGGVGVQLGERVLHVCDVTARRGQRDTSSFAALCAFCKMLCPKPRLADHPVYGANDWYYAYGHNTPAGLLADAQLFAELAAGISNRPYCVIDDGWQIKDPVDAGQWSASRSSFGSMSELAVNMSNAGVRPGIWMRPLIDEINAWPQEWHLSRDHKMLDPTRSEVKQLVATDIRRLCDWGFKLIKHDFSTNDITGRWGKDMADGFVTADGWSFASQSQTTAEVISDLYRTIREAAGDTVVLGCNTVSHLCAGIFELNRIGDDTSGNDWRRNPQMGVNTLAFRGPQSGAFYGADADCCAITHRLPWEKARQWLDLVSRSGTPLFISVERKALTPEIRKTLQGALLAASKPAPLGEPLNWMTSAIPSEWKLGGERVKFDWS
jgi:alpha-galactosidase